MGIHDSRSMSSDEQEGASANGKLAGFKRFWTGDLGEEKSQKLRHHKTYLQSKIDLISSDETNDEKKDVAVIEEMKEQINKCDDWAKLTELNQKIALVMNKNLIMNEYLHLKADIHRLDTPKRSYYEKLNNFDHNVAARQTTLQLLQDFDKIVINNYMNKTYFAEISKRTNLLFC